MAQLSPTPKFTVTYVNSSGYVVPAVGYKLYAYTAGTSTPKDTYTDYTLGSANTNPVVMNTDGQCDLWLSGNYKLVLKTDADVTVWTVDEVRDLTSSQTLTNMTLAGTLTISSTAVTWSGNPTHSGNHTWTGNQVFNGNVTIGDSAADTLTVTPNAVTWSNNPTHSGNHTWSGNQVWNGNSTIGDAAADTSTINATATFPLAVSTHTFGIKVGNTARADTSTLDWYEEGTFTPAITFGGAAVGVTYGQQNGWFTRIGDRFAFNLILTLTSKGSSTGAVKITGLYYISYGGAIQNVEGHMTNLTGLSARPTAFTEVNTGNLQLYTVTLATGATTAMTDADVTNTASFNLTGIIKL